MCVTLIEGYLRAAIRGSKNLYRFLLKILHISLQLKDEFFCSVFFLLFFNETADLQSSCGYLLAICQLCFIDSRTAIAGAIVGLLLVFISSSRFLLRPYDFRHFLFIGSCNFN